MEYRFTRLSAPPLKSDRCRICELMRHSRWLWAVILVSTSTSLFKSITWRRLSLLPRNFRPEAVLWLFDGHPCHLTRCWPLFAPGRNSLAPPVEFPWLLSTGCQGDYKNTFCRASHGRLARGLWLASQSMIKQLLQAAVHCQIRTLWNRCELGAPWRKKFSLGSISHTLKLLMNLPGSKRVAAPSRLEVVEMENSRAHSRAVLGSNPSPATYNLWAINCKWRNLLRRCGSSPSARLLTKCRAFPDHPPCIPVFLAPVLMAGSSTCHHLTCYLTCLFTSSAPPH